MGTSTLRDTRRRRVKSLSVGWPLMGLKESRRAADAAWTSVVFMLLMKFAGRLVLAAYCCRRYSRRKDDVDDVVRWRFT